MAIMELGEHLDLFLMPIIENSSGDGSLGNGLAKNKFGTNVLGV